MPGRGRSVRSGRGRSQNGGGGSGEAKREDDGRWGSADVAALVWEKKLPIQNLKAKGFSQKNFGMEAAAPSRDEG